MIIVIAALLINFPLPATAQAQKPPERTATPGTVATIAAYCKGVDLYTKQHPESKRIFGNIAASTEPRPDRWQEFKSDKDKHVADTGDNLNDAAFVWIRENHVISASFTFSSASGDWTHYVTYYFRKDGRLAKIDSRLNTFHGNQTVRREKFYDSAGKLLRVSAQYFDLQTGKKIKPNTNFMDEPIPLYNDIKSLPFYGILAEKATA